MTKALGGGGIMSRVHRSHVHIQRRLCRSNRAISFYNLLGVPKTADQDELREAYLAKVKQWHPDKFPATDPKRLLAEVKLKELNRAYETLRDTQLRAAYDFGGSEFSQKVSEDSTKYRATEETESESPSLLRVIWEGYSNVFFYVGFVTISGGFIYLTSTDRKVPKRENFPNAWREMQDDMIDNYPKLLTHVNAEKVAGMLPAEALDEPVSQRKLSPNLQRILDHQQAIKEASPAQAAA